MKPASIKPLRCWIYTRVSTEHGLDQEFNSLDAQYDAASAYIKSQAHAGWALIRSRYDDGGCIGVEIARCGQAEMNRVARSLKALGLVRKQRRTGDERTWIYSAPVTNDGSEPPSGSVTTLRLVTARRPVTQETPAAQP